MSRIRQLGILPLLLIQVADWNDALAQAGTVRHDRAEKFVIVSTPPGAIIILSVYDDQPDTLGPAPMLVEHVRGGRPSSPLGFRIRALPRNAGQCEQGRRIDAQMTTPDTIHFDMARCDGTGSRPEGFDWNRVFSEAEVDQKPQLASRVALTYPNAPLTRGIEGSVELEVVIDTAGKADSASLRVIRATHPDFVQPAVFAVLGSAYRPGLIGNRPVRVRSIIPINFGLGSPKVSRGVGGPSVRPRTKRTLIS